MQSRCTQWILPRSLLVHYLPAQCQTTLPILIVLVIIGIDLTMPLMCRRTIIIIIRPTTTTPDPTALVDIILVLSNRR